MNFKTIFKSLKNKAMLKRFLIRSEERRVGKECM